MFVISGAGFHRTVRENDFPQMPFSLGDIVLAFDSWLLKLTPPKRILRTIWCICWCTGYCISGLRPSNDADAARMEARECTLLAGVGVGDPYGAANGGTEKGKAGGDKG